MSTPAPSSSLPLDSARNGPMSSNRSNRPSLNIGAHISLERERFLIGCLAVLFVGMGVVALLGCEEALRAWRHWGGYQLFIVGCFTPIAAVASFISLLGSLKSLQDLNEKDQLVMKVKGIVGEDILLFGLYLTLFAFAGCGVLSVCCLFNQEEIEMVLAAEFSDPAVSSILYPSTSLATVTQALHSAYVLCGYLCFAYVLLALLAFLIQLSLSLDHETTHSILQVESLVLLCVGLFVVLTGGFSMKVKTDFDWEEIPVSVLQTAIGIGVVACAMAVYGFFVGKWEDHFHITCFSLFSLIFIVFSAYFLTAQLQNSATIQHDLTESCLDTMSLVDGRYLQYLGCTHKYEKTAMTAAALTCPKEQIRHIWEDVPESSQFGCLNPNCCGYFISSTKIVMDYLGVGVLFAAIISALSLVSACVLITKISQKGASMFHTADPKIFFAMVIVLILGGGLMYAMIPFSPSPKPDLKPQIAVVSAGTMDPRIVSEGTCVKGPLLTLRPYMFNCTACDRATLQVGILGEAGDVYFSEAQGVNVTARRSDFIQVEGRDPAVLSRLLSSVVFCSKCPLSGGRLNVTLTRREYMRATGGRRLQTGEGGNSTEKTVYDLKAEEVILQKGFAMSFPSPGDQSLSGTIAYQGDGIKGVTVSAHTFNPDCFSLKTQTDPLGAFSFSAPKTPNLSPYPIVLEFSAPGYIPTSLTTQIGGLPLKAPSIPVISLLETAKIQGSLLVTVFDAMKNKRLSNITIDIRSGQRNITGPSLFSALSNDTGLVAIWGLPCGDYTVATGGDGVFLDSVDVQVASNTTYPIAIGVTYMTLTPDQLRVVLTWQRNDLDLDLRTVFDSSPAHRCDVYYADKHCGGTKLYSLSEKGWSGGEAITMREVSAAHYLVYVTSSKPGDFRGAEIKVYSPSSRKPILRIQPSAPPSDSGIWFAFCLNGLLGSESVTLLDQVKSGPISPGLCSQAYGRKN